MRKYPGLGEQIWQAFARRTFDNRLRASSAYGDLDRRTRLSWFDRGRVLSLAATEEHEPARADTHLFVAAGRVRVGSEEHGRGAFVALAAGVPVVALEDCWLALLPDLSGGLADAASGAGRVPSEDPIA
jgi:hypothetical protein